MRRDTLVTTLLFLLGLALTAVADQRSAERARRAHDVCGSGDPAPSIPKKWEWTDAEAKEFWEKHAPKSARTKFKDPIRTAHYVVLTNSSCGKSFGEKMEQNYRRIRDLFPFNEIPGARPLPILLFRTGEEFRSFLVDSMGYSPKAAKCVKGVARGELYATWYESPVDPVHLHEATHQLIETRLGLHGGGSWFHEGLAEYAATSRNDRNAVANRIAAGNAPSWMELIESRDLGADDTHERGAFGSRATTARERYLHAALLIEFLKESEFAKAKFVRFLRAVGSCPRNDLAAIDAALLDVYGEGVTALDERFVKWCRRR